MRGFDVSFQGRRRVTPTIGHHDGLNSTPKRIKMMPKAGPRGSEREKEERTRKHILDQPGRTNGRKDRLIGATGVNRRAFTEGCTIGPPEESEYAVEPVGVDIIKPSDCDIAHYCTSFQKNKNRTYDCRC